MPDFGTFVNFTNYVISKQPESGTCGDTQYKLFFSTDGITAQENYNPVRQDYS